MINFNFLLVFFFVLTGCSSQPVEISDVDNQKFDRIVKHSAINFGINIPCDRLVFEVQQSKKHNAFDLLEYRQYKMTNGLMFFIETNYELQPDQSHQASRYQNAYQFVEQICLENPSLNYLDALQLALKKIDEQ